MPDKKVEKNVTEAQEQEEVKAQEVAPKKEDPKAKAQKSEKESIEAKEGQKDEKIEQEAKAEAIEEKEAEPQAEERKQTVVRDLSFYSGVRNDLPEIRTGDVLRVFYSVVEGGKTRTQVFEGVVIAIKNKGISKTINVRKTSFGIAVERVFPLNSKLIQKIEVKKHSKVRRAKLYYLRKLKGKAAKLKELR